jgi:hypothetical protein
VAFIDAMNALGYTSQDKIVDGICYGRHMMLFRKAHVKSDKVYARLYFRENGVVLHYYFSDVTKHATYIEKCPDYIKDVFVGEYATCTHCKGDKCKFRKSYQIAGKDYEKCNGLTFEFFHPSLDRLESYRDLFLEFYP